MNRRQDRGLIIVKTAIYRVFAISGVSLKNLIRTVLRHRRYNKGDRQYNKGDRRYSKGDRQCNKCVGVRGASRREARRRHRQGLCRLVKSLQAGNKFREALPLVKPLEAEPHRMGSQPPAWEPVRARAVS
ncbi:hypothetical protein [Nostoc sp.]